MRPVRDSLREYSRGLIGGLIFSLPLLYTMEVWWAGFLLGSNRILLLLALIFVLLLGYNTYAGVRPDETWAGVVIDSIEELGLGLLSSAAILTLLGRISFNDSFREAVGKITVEALLLAIGISVGTSQMNHSEESDERGTRPKDILGVVALAACGAVVLATNIAITEEIVVLGLESHDWQLIGIIGMSLLLTGLIITWSDLMKSKHSEGPTWIRNALGTCLAYAVAFCSAGVMLLLFGRFDGLELQPCLAMTIVLALPASMGAAAGKLLIQ